MKSFEEIKAEIDKIRVQYANRNVAAQDYSLDGWILKSKYQALEWVLEAKYCMVCGSEHNRRTMACSKECSEKLYG